MLRPPLRISVLTTHRSPGLDQLLAAPERGEQWELACVMASSEAYAGREAVRRAGIPCVTRDLASFCAAGGRRRSDMAARADYDRETVRLLEEWKTDLVLLVGYLHIVTPVLLDRWPHRVVNLHDADLSLTGADGQPKYRGLRSTRDAIFDGAAETRTTAHLVTPEVDTGPILLLSWPFPTHPLADDARRMGATDVLKEYAYAQREWMMQTAWGPLLVWSARLYAARAVRVVDGRVFVGAQAGPIRLKTPELEPDRQLVAVGETR
jgi:folate-dependent phosphoribosylglycinamide formyltransferase PurN